MTEQLTPEQLAMLVDRKTGIVNDSYLIDGITLGELQTYLEESGVVNNTEALSGYRLEELIDIRQQPQVHAPVAASFGGLKEEGLLSLLMGLVDTRTFQGVRFKACSHYWTHLVTVESTPNREDFYFGLFGGGLNYAESDSPVAMLRLGVEGRGSEVLVLSGKYCGEFVTRTVPGDGVIYTELWYGADSRAPLTMACANSTRDHSYGLSEQEPVDLSKEGLSRLSYETALFQSEFDAMAEPLCQELTGLKTKFTNLKNNR